MLSTMAKGLFRLACDNDLEGVVAKHKHSPYLAEQANWLKVRNRIYSQWLWREELFERSAEPTPFNYWHDCAIACESVEV